MLSFSNSWKSNRLKEWKGMLISLSGRASWISMLPLTRVMLGRLVRVSFRSLDWSLWLLLYMYVFVRCDFRAYAVSFLG